MSNLAGPDPLADSAALRDSQIVVVLKIKPKLRWQTKVLSQANGGIGTDGPVSPDHFIDTRKTEGLCQRIDTHAHGFHELGLENFSRMNRKYLPRLSHGDSVLSLFGNAVGFH